MLWLSGDGWINIQNFLFNLFSQKHGICDTQERERERGAPLGWGPHLGEASRSGSKQFPLQRPHQGKHQLSAGAGGRSGGGGVGFNFDNRAFKCPNCCPTCSMWKLCRSLVLWNINMNIKHDQWNVIICGKCTVEEKQFIIKIKLKCLNVQFSFLGKRSDQTLTLKSEIVAKNNIYKCGT